MTKRAPWVALLVGCCVLLLTPFAYATPPDPTWIAGLWDEGDHDDVVYFATSAVGMPGMHLSTTPPVICEGRRPVERNADLLLEPRASIAPTRAPPLA